VVHIAWSTPQTWTNTTLTVTALNREVRDNLTELGVRRGFKLQRAANLSIANNTLTTVTWDTEIVDSDGFFSAPGTTVTVPTGLTGVYGITLQVSWGASVGTAAFFGLTMGGVTYRLPCINETAFGMTIVGDLTATNTITGSVYQLSGGAVNMTGYLLGYRLGL
jgi:hypothetical protein